jgi:hypothetical protein
MILDTKSHEPLSQIESQIRFDVICGKPIAIFESHHFALLPWQRWAEKQNDPVRVLSLDYHTDKHKAFLRYGHGGLALAAKDGDKLAECARQKRLMNFNAKDSNSVAQAILDLRHDEHIDAAINGKILDLAFVISYEDQDYISSNEQLEFDRRWQHLCYLEKMQKGLERPSQDNSSTYCMPPNRIVILKDDTPRNDQKELQRWRDQVIDTMFLEGRLQLIERICQTSGIPGLFDLPFILDIDLDAFNTKKSVSPCNTSVFFELIRRSIGITVARETACVKECRLHKRGPTARWLEEKLIEQVKKAICS